MLTSSRSGGASIAVFALAVLTAPALAGDRAVPGNCEEAQARARGNSTASEATGRSAAKRDNASVEPAEEAYVSLSRSAPPATSAAAPRVAETATTAPGPARLERQPAAPRAEAPATPARARRGAPAKPRMSVPDLPATPGMGTLLRVGITAGREIS